MTGRCIIGGVAAALLLSSCTPADLITGRNLTFDAGALYIQENHDRRRDMRQSYYDIVDAVVDKCEGAAREAEFAGELETALERVQFCLNFIQLHYPDLATFELLKEGAKGINDIRTKFKEEDTDAAEE